MGLRLVAHYYDWHEAQIARAALEHAGVVAFLHGAALIAVQWDYAFAFGGYRLMAMQEELDDAVTVLLQARGTPLIEGEVLVRDDSLVMVTFCTVIGLIIVLLVGILTPFRIRRWTYGAQGG